MKKHIKLLRCCIIGISLIYISIFVFGCSENNSLYPEPGRNTVEIFGDGRFEIFSGEYENIRYYCLYDRKDDQEGQVEGNIINYIDIDSNIYAVGTEGRGKVYYDDEISNMDNMPEEIYYTKVNYESGEIMQDTELNSFSEDDKKMFNDLSDSPSPFEEK